MHLIFFAHDGPCLHEMKVCSFDKGQALPGTGRPFRWIGRGVAVPA
jgi:hypothetical protein